VLLLALQSSHALALLVVWPYSSAVVDVVDVVCACLDLACLVPLLVAYSSGKGAAQLPSSYTKVGLGVGQENAHARARFPSRLCVLVPMGRGSSLQPSSLEATSDCWDWAKAIVDSSFSC
jgi:hypothetical protein